MKIGLHLTTQVVIAPLESARCWKTRDATFVPGRNHPDECTTLATGAWYSNLSTLGRDCTRRMRISVIAIMHLQQNDLRMFIRESCLFLPLSYIFIPAQDPFAVSSIESNHLNQ
jgi:hypothetical protein